MSNMSYCRFQNTHIDLLECHDALEELVGDTGIQSSTVLSDNELRAAKALVRCCVDIVVLVVNNINETLSDEECRSIDDLDDLEDNRKEIDACLERMNVVARNFVDLHEGDEE
jgi:hypothetical protein